MTEEMNPTVSTLLPVKWSLTGGDKQKEISVFDIYISCKIL